MRYWLFKSEPSVWGWSDQVAKGDAGEEWDGVRNYQARNFMREMTLGDRGFFYHSQTEKAIVGVVEICAEAHPDSTDDTGRWDCVDIRALAPVQTPVTLDMVKADPRLADLALVTRPRLSVQPVPPEAWAILCDMAGVQGVPE
jgi:predicted RNA-binding protein with PUA-like domain